MCRVLSSVVPRLAFCVQPLGLPLLCSGPILYSSFIIYHSALNSLLSATYFGPVQWYQKLNRSGLCYIEQHDHFIKQTYRNRCVIATTQGTQALTVPIERYDGVKCEMRDIRISDHGAWRHLHWNALVSAYGESPFFEFYADDLRPFFEKRWQFLYDYDLAITEKMCELLDIHPTLRRTEEYIKLPDSTADDTTKAALIPSDGIAGNLIQWADYREVIRPKHPLPDADFQPRPYYQVYKQKFGFLPNLSILDLLFNEGNEAVLFL